MHSTELGPNNVPAFLSKLWKLVDDSKYDKLIHWTPEGLSFVIHDQTEFSKEILPLYFKHNNMASFIRQLNMYGFKKIVNIEQGGLKSEKDDMEFQHQYFSKDNEVLLTLIRRKLPGNKSSAEEVKVKNDIIDRMLADVKQLRGHQETMDSKFQNIKQENETLWREVATLRQKHMQQQQIVNKLIQFLVTLVRPNRGLPLKRKHPLMINDTSHTRDKIPNLTRHFPKYEKTMKNEDGSSGCKSGPVIHDVTDIFELGDDFLNPQKVILPDVVDPVHLATEAAGVPCFVEESSKSPMTEFPVSPSVSSVAGCSQSDLSADIQHMQLPESFTSGQSPSDVTQTDAAIPLETALKTVIGEDETNLDSSGEVALLSSAHLARTDMTSQVDSMQANLDTLRDLLSGSGYSLNASTLLGVCSANIMNTLLDEAQLFDPDEPLPSAGISDDILLGAKNEITGNELMQYNTPSFMEIADDDDMIPRFEDQSEFNEFEDIASVLSGTNNDLVLTTPDPMLSAPNFSLSKIQSKSKKS